MEPLTSSAELALEEETQVAVARRCAGALAERLGLTADAISRAELACVELCANALRHGGGGRMFAGTTSDGRGLQMIVADKGPGIGSIERAMADGFTTGGTGGTGLGAVKRASQAFDVWSARGAGTVISCMIRDIDASGSDAEAVLSTCFPGETENGDCWSIHRGGQRVLYTVVDGLGHGSVAAEASALAIQMVAKAFSDNPQVSLTELLNRMHGPMRATRGAAISFVSVAGRVATCCGVGNVSTVLYGADGHQRTVLSHNGTLGHQMRRVQEFTYPIEPGTLLVMHSDGLTTRWKMEQYTGLERHAAATIAGVHYRDAVRGRDDATVLVARPAQEVTHG